MTHLYPTTSFVYTTLLLGQNDGGLYAIRDPHTINALPIRITAGKKGWFYHRAVHVKLPTGQEGILTARAKKPLLGRGIGELVWLSLPTDLDSCFPDMPASSEISALDAEPPKLMRTTRHTTMNKKAIESALAPTVKPIRPIASTTPWVETILAEGPDVMFEVLDLDRSDDCLEVISAHFFGQKLSVHSIKAIPEAPFIEISAMRTLDTIGRPYGLCLATMTPTASRPKAKESTSIQADYSSCDNSEPTHLLVSTHECSYDIPSAYNMALSALGGIYPSIITGAAFAFRNGQQSVRPGSYDVDTDIRGGSLFSYEIPRQDSIGDSSTGGFSRSTASLAKSQINGLNGLNSQSNKPFASKISKIGKAEVASLWKDSISDGKYTPAITSIQALQSPQATGSGGKSSIIPLQSTQVSQVMGQNMGGGGDGGKGHEWGPPVLDSDTER